MYDRSSNPANGPTVADAERRSWLDWILALALLVLLACFVVPKLFGTSAGHPPRTRVIVARGLNGAIDRFKSIHGHYPHQLIHLAEKPGGEVAERYQDLDAWSPLLEKRDLRDVWGIEYGYRCPGVHNRTTFDLWSFGPDRVTDTADDIPNWDADDAGDIPASLPTAVNAGGRRTAGDMLSFAWARVCLRMARIATACESSRSSS